MFWRVLNKLMSWRVYLRFAQGIEFHTTPMQPRCLTPTESNDRYGTNKPIYLIIDFSINGLFQLTMHGKSPSITTDSTTKWIRTPTDPFLHVFIFGNMFPESYGFVAMPVTSGSNMHVLIFPYLNLWMETKLFDLVTGTATKPRLSGNMLQNINTCENRWSNFSENFKIVALKLHELTRSVLSNQSIYFNFVRWRGPWWCYHF